MQQQGYGDLARRRCWRAEGAAVGEIFLEYQEDEQVGANERVVGCDGVCERIYGRIQVMDASLAGAGGEPARTSLAVLVDRQ